VVAEAFLCTEPIPGPVTFMGGVTEVTRAVAHPADDVARRMVSDCPRASPCFGDSSLGPLEPPKKTPRRLAIRGQSEVEGFLCLIDNILDGVHRRGDRSQE
jgi:hypothetical protein